MKLHQILIFVGVLMMTSALLTSCAEHNPVAEAEQYALPDGLKDCKVYVVTKQNGGGKMKVLRCPNSSTTTSYQSGKTTQSVTLVEGKGE